MSNEFEELELILKKRAQGNSSFEGQISLNHSNRIQEIIDADDFNNETLFTWTKNIYPMIYGGKVNFVRPDSSIVEMIYDNICHYKLNELSFFNFKDNRYDPPLDVTLMFSSNAETTIYSIIKRMDKLKVLL